MKQTPKEILDTMLGCLGFVFEIKEIESDAGLTLQVYTSEKESLIGNNGQTIDDLQYLLNRVRKFAESVRETGMPFHLEPMNSYDRRLIHNAFKDDPQVTTWSPSEDARMKRITLKKR